MLTTVASRERPTDFHKGSPQPLVVSLEKPSEFTKGPPQPLVVSLERPQDFQKRFPHPFVVSLEKPREFLKGFPQPPSRSLVNFTKVLHNLPREVSLPSETSPWIIIANSLSLPLSKSSSYARPLFNSLMSLPAFSSLLLLLLLLLPRCIGHASWSDWLPW